MFKRMTTKIVMMLLLCFVFSMTAVSVSAEGVAPYLVDGTTDQIISDDTSIVEADSDDTSIFEADSDDNGIVEAYGYYLGDIV